MQYNNVQILRNPLTEQQMIFLVLQTNAKTETREILNFIKPKTKIKYYSLIYAQYNITRIHNTNIRASKDESEIK